MKMILRFFLILPFIVYAPVIIAADPFVIPQEIQKGVNPEKAIETLKNIFQFSPAPVELKTHQTSPELDRSLRQIRSGAESFLKIDAGIQRINVQIKETLGIDIPVLVGAIWKGIVWLVKFVYTFFSSLIPSL